MTVVLAKIRGTSITIPVNVDADGSVYVTGDWVHVEDAPFLPGDEGVLLYAVRNDAGGSLVDADGDKAPLQVNAAGELVVSGGIPPADTPVTYNVPMVLANTEYAQALPANTRRFCLQCQGNQDVRYAFVAGQVAGPIAPYGLLKAGYYYWEDQIDLVGVTLYFACGVVGQVAEIVAWT